MVEEILTPSLKLTFSHLKMDGWNTFSFPFGIRPNFRCYVSFRECMIFNVFFGYRPISIRFDMDNTLL